MEGEERGMGGGGVRVIGGVGGVGVGRRVAITLLHIVLKGLGVLGLGGWGYKRTEACCYDGGSWRGWAAGGGGGSG